MSEQLSAWPTTDEVRATFGAHDRLAFDRWLAAHDREVKAEALREAAQEAYASAWWADDYAGRVRSWLRARADRIESQETP